MTEVEEQRSESIWPVLHQATGSGNVEEVKKLLNPGNNVDINEKEHIIAGYTPLALAVSGGHLEVVRLLLQQGADVNAGNNYITPLRLAELHGHTEIADLLRQHGGKSESFVPDDLK